MTPPRAPTALLALGLALTSSLARADAESEGDAYRDPFEEVVEGKRTLPPAPPASLLELVEYLGPVVKYYAVLLGLFALARYLSRMVEAEDNLKDKEQLKKRPNLRHNLMESEDEEDEEGEEDEEESESEGATTAPKATGQKKNTTEEDDVHEELITDGSKLVKMSESELKERRKKKNHPLFEGLQKIEEDLRQKKKDGDDANVSWNELHQSMLKRYQQKFPEHGLRVQTDDDYDDEFKELMKKHNIDPEAIRREISKDK